MARLHDASGESHRSISNVSVLRARSTEAGIFFECLQVVNWNMSEHIQLEAIEQKN